jgi:glucose/arabinose dehydrogenase
MVMSRAVTLAAFFFAALLSIAQSAGVLKGKQAFGDWRGDAPGVRRQITPADMPPPYATESADEHTQRAGRPTQNALKVPAGFRVERIETELENPRVVVTAPNGDLFVSESEEGRVSAIRLGSDGKVLRKEEFATGLKQPFGIAFYPPGPNPFSVYVANTDEVIRFPYRAGDMKPRGASEHVADISGGGRLRGGGHWTRDIVFSPDGRRMFVSVGSRSNVSDNDAEKFRANILEFDPNGGHMRIFASGIRNAVGITIHPTTGQLWASVNERDGLGDDLPPDYITHVEDGGFYGWPWYYIGGNQDPRHKGAHPELRTKVTVPDVLVQAHSASLIMKFYTGKQFPQEYQGDAFAAQHGSWNRSKRTGYKIIRLPMKNGKATGEYEDFVTGFVANEEAIWGRPVGITVASDGALIFTDDLSNSLWRVTYAGKQK